MIEACDGDRSGPGVRVAAVGDLHVGCDDEGRVGLDDVEDHADLLLLAGDLTRCGAWDEAAVLARALAPLRLPVVAVLGNHDVHRGRAGDVVDLLTAAEVHVLDGAAVHLEVRGLVVGVAGAKGFGGGFAGACATEFGEPEMRAFAAAGRRSADRFARALAALDAPIRLGLLHYSPVPETLAGEPPEIHAFLGSGLLGEAVDRHGADLVVHGHAHRGTARGRTPGGVPVRNVARPVIGERYRVVTVRPRATSPPRSDAAGTRVPASS